MNIKHIFLSASLVCVAMTLHGQSNLPKTTVGGHQFYYYEVNAGESIYGIAAKIGVTKDEIIKNNPDAADGVENGMKLYFPVDKQDSNVPAATVATGQRHTVEEGETLYGLAKRYGTTVEEIIAANPGTDKGIKTGQVLTIPGKGTTASTKVNANQQVMEAFGRNTTMQVSVPQGSDPIFHTLQAGEDICSIAKQYNATIEGIISANPGLKPDEYTTGAKVKVVPNTALPFIYERTGRRNYKYEVKRGETYASIAADNGITENELKAANPDLKKVKKGKVITLPKPFNERVTGEMATIPIDELRDYYLPRINDLYDNLVAKRLENEVNIALVLPFQLHKSAPPKQAYLYTDFYKGFLLALDSTTKVSDKHINLKVYDTQHNLNVTDSLLSLPEMKTMNIIIAPSEPQQLAKINAFG